MDAEYFNNKVSAFNEAINAENKIDFKLKETSFPKIRYEKKR